MVRLLLPQPLRLFIVVNFDNVLLLLQLLQAELELCIGVRSLLEQLLLRDSPPTLCLLVLIVQKFEPILFCSILQ